MTVKKGYRSSWIAKLNTSWHVRFQQFILLSYYFFEFADFFFHETYNTWLHERYRNNPSTHPKRDRNQVTVSQTLQQRTCRRPKVFQLLDACNRF